VIYSLIKLTLQTVFNLPRNTVGYRSPAHYSQAND